jgi:hypothetical protein
MIPTIPAKQVKLDLPQELKPAFLAASNGTAAQVAEKLRTTDPSRTKVRSG